MENDVLKTYIFVRNIRLYTSINITVRRVAAEGKRKVRTEEEELASKSYISGNNHCEIYQKNTYEVIVYLLTHIFLSLGYHSEWGAKIGRIRIKVRKMCKQQWWFWLVVTLVFLNTCTVAVEHYGQPAWLTNFLGK